MNDVRKEVGFADIKLDSSRINLRALKEKALKLEDEYKGYKKVAGIAYRKYQGVS